jgi:ABC-2 type transport system ATP-binding protein
MGRTVVVPAKRSALARYVSAGTLGAVFYLAQAGALAPLAYVGLSVWPELFGQRRFARVVAPVLCGVFAELGRYLGLSTLSGDERSRQNVTFVFAYGVGFGAAEAFRAAVLSSRSPSWLTLALLAVPAGLAGPIPTWVGTLFFEANWSALAGVGAVRGRWGILAALTLCHVLLNFVLVALMSAGFGFGAQCASLATATVAGSLAVNLWRRRLALTATSESASEQAEGAVDVDSIGVEKVVCLYDHAASHSKGELLGPLSFRAKAGQVLALLGPNGAGKTTTLRVLAGLLRPVGGQTWVFGTAIDQENACRVNALIGLAAEETGLYPKMRVCRYLEFFASLYHIPRWQRDDRITELLRLLELEQGLDLRIATLSKGARQKLALARALLHQPRLLLLDEPTAALDPRVACSVRRAIAALKANECTVVIATHDLDEAQELADEFLIMRRGQIVRRLHQSHHGQGALTAGSFEVRLAPSAHEAPPILETLAGLDGVEQVRFEPGVDRGELVLVFSTTTPQMTNPAVLKALLGMGFKPYVLTRHRLSIEQIYSPEGALDTSVGESALGCDTAGGIPDTPARAKTC